MRAAALCLLLAALLLIAGGAEARSLNCDNCADCEVACDDACDGDYVRAATFRGPCQPEARCTVLDLVDATCIEILVVVPSPISLSHAWRALTRPHAGLELYGCVQPRLYLHVLRGRWRWPRRYACFRSSCASLAQTHPARDSRHKAKDVIAAHDALLCLTLWQAGSLQSSC